MIRGILTRVLGGGRRTTGANGRRTRGASTPSATGSTSEIERGARTLFRGLSRRRRGLSARGPSVVRVHYVRGDGRRGTSRTADRLLANLTTPKSSPDSRTHLGNRAHSHQRSERCYAVLNAACQCRPRWDVWASRLRLTLRVHRTSPSCQSSVGVSPPAVATAADARWSGWMWAMMVCRRCWLSQAMTPLVASVAMPRPCQGVPTTQAISAIGPASDGLTVTWTVPARQASPRRWVTQLHQSMVGSGEPATSRW